MHRERLVVGNWKMHTNLADAVVLASKIRSGMAAVSNDVTVVLCPPTVWLYPVAEVLEHSAPNLKLGAQNVWPGKEGRSTGEVSAGMLAQMCQFTLVGHSERRVHQLEDSTLIGKKVSTALHYGVRPILCVGEFRRLVPDRYGRLRARRGDTASDIFAQLRDGIAGLPPVDVGQVIVAYEPVWAIGGRIDPDLHYAEAVIGELRRSLDDFVGSRVSHHVSFLYGGSLSAANAAQFAHSAEVDGVLVGGASLRATDFLSIVSEFHLGSHRQKEHHA